VAAGAGATALNHPGADLPGLRPADPQLRPDHPWLFPALLAEGLTYAEIAGRLVVSVNTVRFHVKEIYGKLGVNRQAQAVARAQELGLL
jgi:hypothetical protein